MRHFILFALLILSTQIKAQIYTLPSLKYSYASYEPFVDAQTMEIHHSKHHQAYVNNLNKAITGTSLEKVSLNELMMYASFRTEAIRNNTGGHYNHTLFWEILAPKEKQSSISSSEFDLAVKTQFGNLDSIKTKLNQAATSRFGSGWAWLIVTPDKKLMITNTQNQDNPIMDVAKDRGIPILGIDVWEHAYYLKYQNKRADYLNAIWSLIDWGVVSEKYNAAIKDPLLAMIEKDSWPELKEFHKIMGQTFHPSESGNLEPVRKKSGELLAKAVILNNSTPPASLNKPEIHSALETLEKQCAEIYKLKNKKVKDDFLKGKITAAHKTFHLVQGLCHD